MAETTHAGTEVPAGEHGGKGAFPPFESETFASQLVWLVIAFGLLYILMSKLALPRVAGILKTREDTIASDLAAAQKAKADSDAAVAAYEQSLAKARAEAQSIAGQTRDAMAAEAEATRKTLEAQLAEKLGSAEAQIAATKTAALGNVRGIATEATAAIIERLTGKAPDAAAVQAAVDAAVAR